MPIPFAVFHALELVRKSCVFHSHDSFLSSLKTETKYKRHVKNNRPTGCNSRRRRSYCHFSQEKLVSRSTQKPCPTRIEKDMAKIMLLQFYFSSDFFQSLLSIHSIVLQCAIFSSSIILVNEIFLCTGIN